MSEVLTKPAGVPDFAKSSDELHDALEAKIQKEAKPSFFKLKAQLPSMGRTNVPMASSQKMWVTLKTYAHDGENELHAHPNEDHSFVVLQGQATFYGPNGEEKVIGKDEGVLLPHGTFYWFKATSDEPLVMVRIGCAAFDGSPKGKHGRIDINGKPMAGDSVENKSVKPVMTDKWYG